MAITSSACSFKMPDRMRDAFGDRQAFISSAMVMRGLARMLAMIRSKVMVFRSSEQPSVQRNSILSWWLFLAF